MAKRKSQWLKRLSALLMAATLTASVSAGSFSFSPVNNDANSGIGGPAKAYTHLLDFGAGPAATVNGYLFQQVTDASLGGVTNVAYDINSGTRNNFGVQGGYAGTTGGVFDLYSDFMFNGGNAAGGMATITLNNLEAGEWYDTRIYVRQFGGLSPDVPPAGRSSRIGFDTNGDNVGDDFITINEDNVTGAPARMGADGQGYYLSYRFQADSSSLSVDFTQFNENQSWHVYGVTNEYAERIPLDLYNTGVDDKHEPLAVGSGDPHYQYVEGGVAGTVQQNHPAWGPGNDVAGTWLSVVDQGTTGIPPQVYTFRTEFDVPAGYDASTAEISYRASADNSVKVFLNGSDTGTSVAGFGGLSAPQTISSGFVNGNNELDFLLNNSPPGDNPGGMRVEIIGDIQHRVAIEIFDTGLDSNGDPLAIGGVDANWTLSGAAVYAVPGPIPPWIANSADSQWIGLDGGTSNAEPGNYTYETKFDLSGLDHESAVLNIQLAQDDTLVDILLNGVSTGLTSATGFNTLSGLLVLNDGFVAGENVLAVVVANGGAAANPHGVNIRVGGSARVIPEPSSLMLLALGMGGFIRRRR